MEFRDLYNKDRQPLNKQIKRGEKPEVNEYFFVVHVCLFNSKNEMLIQQRQSFKSSWPNCWDVSASGGVLTGESTQVAGQREVFEELGLSVDLKNIRPHFTVNFENGFDDFYIINKDFNIADLKLQKEEVQNAKWATKSEILEMIENGEFINYHAGLIELLFDIKKGYGVHTRK